MTMRDGSAITIQKLAACIQRLRGRGQIDSLGSEPAACPPEVRTAAIEAARKKGWLHRFAVALQRAVPGQLRPDSWEYKWGRRRFVSFFHACRDVFLALEQDDQDELKRLAGLCSQDEQIHFPVNVLVVVCMDPFQPAYLERLIPQYRDLVLSAGLHQETMLLRLNHPVFAYARTWLAANRQDLDKSLLERCVVHLVERDLLAGDFPAARRPAGDLRRSGHLDHPGHAGVAVGPDRGGPTGLRTGAPPDRQEQERPDRAPPQLPGLPARPAAGPVRAAPGPPTGPDLADLAGRKQRPTRAIARRTASWLRCWPGTRATTPRKRQERTVRPFYSAGRPSSDPGQHPPDADAVLALHLAGQGPEDPQTHADSRQSKSALQECEEGGARWLAMQITRLMGKLGVSLPA